MAILTMPIIVLAILRILASIADARVTEKSARLVKEIDALGRSAEMQADAAKHEPPRLTGTPPRDQG